MKILLNLYGSNGQPLKTSLIGEHLEFGDISARIQKMCKRIEEELGIGLDEKKAKWEVGNINLDIGLLC